MKYRVLGLSVAAIMVLTGNIVFNPPPLLIWNATQSVQRGLYLRVGSAVEREVLIALKPDPKWRKLITERHYLPENVPLLKRIAAVEGDIICRHGNTILINNEPVAQARIVDAQGREMPVWAGCFSLQEGEVFLLNAHENSLDGRYFQATKASHILGSYRLIWAVR